MRFLEEELTYNKGGEKQMQKKLWTVISVLLILGMVLAGCAPAATPTPTPRPKPTEVPPTQPPPTEPPPPPPTLSVGQVTDMGGIDDASFNQTAWEGILRAVDELGADGKFIESQEQADYAKNIQ
jgi:basic membrane protein A